MSPVSPQNALRTFALGDAFDRQASIVEKGLRFGQEIVAGIH
jgi:hypothetical protein